MKSAFEQLRCIQMAENNVIDTKLEMRRLALERYKARLDYRKFLLGSVCAAIAIAAIPPLFQLATAALEYVKSQAQLRIENQNKAADRLAKQDEFHQGYIKDFLANALNQDVELRIRFAEYFAFVSAENSRQGWIEYRKRLLDVRKDIRSQIDQMEGEWQQKSRARATDSAEFDRLERNLAWAYNEVGYVKPNRSVQANPRAQPVDQDGTQFSSLVVGGFFSSNPNDRQVPVSIRMNNPASLTVAPWVLRRSGFAGTVEGSLSRHVIFRTPEHGVASWYYMVRTPFGFGKAQKFSLSDFAEKTYGKEPAGMFLAWAKTRLPSGYTDFDINDDTQMLELARVVFHYEAGRPTPLKDEQILFAMKNERAGTLPP